MSSVYFVQLNDTIITFLINSENEVSGVGTEIPGVFRRWACVRSSALPEE